MILFTIFSNSLYHRKITKQIQRAKSEINDEKQLLECIKYKGGVNTWVVWASGILTTTGIIAALLIPILINN